MQCYINVSMGDRDCLGGAGFWCHSGIFAVRSKAALLWHQVRELRQQV